MTWAVNKRIEKEKGHTPMDLGAVESRKENQEWPVQSESDQEWSPWSCPEEDYHWHQEEEQMGELNSIGKK